MSAPHSSADPIIGLDLGTTNSLVAVCDARGPRILPDEEGRAMLPSVVYFPPDGAEPVVGWSAREESAMHAGRTVMSIKRLMGRSMEEVRAEVAELPYVVEAGSRGLASVKMDGRLFTPQEVSAMILRSLRLRAEKALGVVVRRAVVTVPAYFDDAQRQATRDAGTIAGLEIVRIVNEPTASVLAYGLDQRETSPRTIAVYDLGGGTFDISILRITPAESTASATAGGAADPGFFEVLATAGDTRLGGDDLDRAVVMWLLNQAGIDESSLTPADRQRLRTAAETAKIALSERDSTVVECSIENETTARAELSRSEFEGLIAPFIQRTIASCRRAMRDATISAGEIDRVIMVGGSTRIPAVRAAAAEVFGTPPYTAIDPDQVVALGAAVQGAILAGGITDMLLLDVIPLSLGIETVGGAVAKLIVRNSRVPARATEMFSTSVDGQVSVKFHVLQGERELVRDCRSLGEFHLRDVPPMPAGIPQIEVEFLVDADGILSVHALERRSGKRAGIQVVPRHGLTREEVDRLERESIEHAREDMTAHRVIDLLVHASLDVKWIGETLARVKEHLEPEYRRRMEELLDEVKDYIRSAKDSPATVNADKFQSAKETLDRESVRLQEIAIADSLRQ